MRTLYLIACAAEPAQYVDEGARRAQAAGWDVCVVLTPSAARWWQSRTAELVELTGHPVRSQYKLPWEPDVLPKADAMVVAPLSCTSLNKWGNGIADTLALGLASEAVHLGVPVVAVPYFNQAQAAQPAVRRSIDALRAQGVRYLDGSERPERPQGSRSPEGSDRPQGSESLDGAERFDVPEGLDGAERFEASERLNGSQPPGVFGGGPAAVPPAGGRAFPWHLALAALDAARG